MADEEMQALRSKWTTLYADTLPKLARAKDAAQPRWPVTLDHCFARIILDNTVGRGVLQWDSVINKPAVRNMTQEQLQEAIDLGEQIQCGQADLVALDQKSLKARGKGEKKYTNAEKRKSELVDDNGGSKSPVKRAKTQPDKKQSILSFGKTASKQKDTDRAQPSTESPTEEFSTASTKGTSSTSFPNPNTPQFLLKIQNHAGLTPYRKRLYSTLLSVPVGHYTTYQAMAIYLKSSARAVGNGMRNNPYAPDVPCHRVLASDGSIGGFYGSWGEEGKYAGEKRGLLSSEGVYFDSRGKVKGPVFRDLEDLSKRNVD